MVRQGDFRWWLLEGDAAAECVTRVGSLIRDGQAWRRTLDDGCASLFTAGAPPAAGGLVWYLPDAPLDDEDLPPVAYNVVRRCVRTAVARVARGKPRPMFLTVGADWKAQRRAQKREKFLDGEFFRLAAYQTFEQVLQDAAIFGTGHLYVFDLDGRVAIERVAPGEIVVDDREARAAEPRSIYRRQLIDRAIVQELYPDHEGRIADAQTVTDLQTGSDAVADQIEVWTAWYRSRDMLRCVVSCGSVALLDTETEGASLPLARLRWEIPVEGYWGSGIAAQLAGYQYEITAATRVIRESLRGGLPRWAVPVGSGISAENFDDTPNRVLAYAGPQPPILLAPTPISPSYGAWVEALRAQSSQEIGISEATAAGERPAGLNSGLAIQRWEELDDARLQPQARRYDQFVIDAAQLVCEVAERIWEESGSYETDAYRAGERWVERLDWAEGRTDEPYRLQVYPTSSLPQSVAGRTDVVMAWASAGLIDQPTMRRLLNFPDVEADNNLNLAPYEFVLWTIDQLFEGKDCAPEPIMGDQQLVVRLVQSAWLHARTRGAPERILLGIQTYLDNAVMLGQRVTQGQGVGAPAPAPEQATGLTAATPEGRIR